MNKLESIEITAAQLLNLSVKASEDGSQNWVIAGRQLVL